MKLFFSILFAALMMGCNKYLDIVPKGQVVPTTVHDLYTMLRDNNTFVPSSIGGILMTDEVKIYDDEVNRIFFKPERFLNAYLWKDHLYSGENENDEDWNRFYAQIYVCNIVLDKIDDAPGEDEAMRAIAKGEALMHRAYAYLMLVNLYALHYDENTAAKDMGVPLHVKADINAALGRASVKDVYKVIEDDLLLAADKLPLTTSINYYPPKAAAYGLLAKMYLYMGNWAQAKLYAGKAIEQRPFLYDYNSFDFYQGMPQMMGLGNYPMRSFENTEIVFQKEMVATSFIVAVYMTDEHRALYQDGDRRLYFSEIDEYFFGKNLHGGTLFVKDNFHREGIGTPEFYLISAEANARLKNVPDAIADLNTLRLKRFTTGKYVAYQTNVSELQALQLVLNERRIELFQEPWRWFDLKRLNKDERFAKTLTRTLNGVTYTLKPGDHNYVLAIPKKVLNLNSNVKPNPRDNRN